MTNEQIAAMAAEFIAAIVATIYIKQHKTTALIWLVPLFWYIALNERLAYSFWRVTGKSNSIFYNIYDLILPMTLLYILYESITDFKRKKLVLILSIICIGVFIIDFATINPLVQIGNYAYFVATIIVIVSIMFYLIDVLYSKEVIEVKKNVLFYVMCAFLIMNISIPVIEITKSYFKVSNPAIIADLFTIQASLVILSYLLIALGYIMGRKTN